MNDGNETIDITNNSQYGELIYDSNTKTVRYKFNTTWLSNNDNYKGQNINMTITTSLNEVNRNFTNVANTYLDGISFPSNDVIDTYVKKSVVYRYVSGTNGKMLPSAISTSTGEYKIIDNNTYLVGEEVQRSNIVEIGTKYSVYENGVHVGDWILKNWSEDSITMKYDGTEFVGTWIYVAIDAKVSSSNPLTGDNIYIWFGMLILGLLPGVLIAIKLKKSEVR